MQNGETTATPTPRALFETIGQGAEEVNNIADDSEESQKLVEEITGQHAKNGVIGRFVQDLRGMRGQMDVENNARRYHTKRKK